MEAKMLYDYQANPDRNENYLSSLVLRLSRRLLWIISNGPRDNLISATWSF